MSESPDLNKSEIRHGIFVREYLKDLNGTRAAIAAGYSENSARSTASELLTNPNIQAELQRLNAKRFSRLEVSAERVIAELARLAFYDPRQFWNEDGTLKEPQELDEDTARALQGFEVEKLYQHFGKGQAENTGTVAKIKMADKGINLERLGKHLKLFTDKVDLSVNVSLSDRLQRALEQIDGGESEP